MNIDTIIYQNITHLLEKNGVTERQCTLHCRLNPNFFLNFRNGKTKHFRVCDIDSIAKLFEVDINYLCQYKNTRDDFFLPRNKLKTRDEKILLAAFRRLDPVGRIIVADAINEEIKNTKERHKQKLKNRNPQKGLL